MNLSKLKGASIMSRISYFTDMEKSVVTANFIKRGWVAASNDEEWNFYWLVSNYYFLIMNFKPNF